MNGPRLPFVPTALRSEASTRRRRGSALKNRSVKNERKSSPKSQSRRLPSPKGIREIRGRRSAALQVGRKTTSTISRSQPETPGCNLRPRLLEGAGERGLLDPGTARAPSRSRSRPRPASERKTKAPRFRTIELDVEGRRVAVTTSASHEKKVAGGDSDDLRQVWYWPTS